VSHTPPALNHTPCTIRHLRYSLPFAECEKMWLLCPEGLGDLPHGNRRVPGRSGAPVGNCKRPSLRFLWMLLPCPTTVFAQECRLRRAGAREGRLLRLRRWDALQAGDEAARLTDFWVKPSEAMIRRWCKEFADGLDFGGDYQAWVVEEFSGILCVDEVYQDKLALLLAVDPATPDGDRLVGYELTHGRVERKDVEDFLSRLKRAGIEPEEVITDGSPLYPNSLKEVWPGAAHQLCLFHETRLVTAEIYKARGALRKVVPKPPPTPLLVGDCSAVRARSARARRSWPPTELRSPGFTRCTSRGSPSGASAAAQATPATP
jgi:hypothetical protein